MRGHDVGAYAARDGRAADYEGDVYVFFVATFFAWLEAVLADVVALRRFCEVSQMSRRVNTICMQPLQQKNPSIYKDTRSHQGEGFTQRSTHIVGGVDYIGVVQYAMV